MASRRCIRPPPEFMAGSHEQEFPAAFTARSMALRWAVDSMVDLQVEAFMAEAVIASWIRLALTDSERERRVPQSRQAYWSKIERAITHSDKKQKEGRSRRHSCALRRIL